MKKDREKRKELELAWLKRLTLMTRGSRLYVESNKLRAEANKLWNEAILATCGNIKLEWKNWDVWGNEVESDIQL